MSPRENRGVVATSLRLAGRVLMLLVLVAGTVAVSLGLANTGGDRPVTSTVEPAAAKPDASAAVARQRSAATAAATARLVSAQDAKVLDLVRGVPYPGAEYRVLGTAVDTVVLTARPTPYTRTDLVRLGALAPRGADDYLQASVLVAPGASLLLTGGRPILMRSDPTGFASIVAWKAELRLIGTATRPLQIRSVDAGRNRVDTNESDGRAFIRTVGSRTEVRHAELSHLGFWSGRTGGLSVEGGGDVESASTGAVAAATTSPLAGRQQVTISDLTTRRMHYGLYAHDVRSGSVRRTQLVASSAQGLLMHGNTRGVLVEDTSVTGSGTDGFAVARGSHDLVLRRVVSQDNAGDGVRIDGRAMAVGPTAGGADPRQHGDVRVVGATLADNGRSGASVVGAVHVSISGSTISSNTDGITVRERAANVRLTDNRVLDSRGFGIGVTDGPSSVVVRDNAVAGAATGVAVRTAVATVAGNHVSSATEHGISLVGRAAGSRVLANTISGVGPSAVGDSRLLAPTTVVVDANDASSWQVRTGQTRLQRLENHPLLLLWLPILLLPLAAGVVTLRRRRTGAERSRKRAKARLSVAHASASRQAADHPAALDPDPDTRTRVTVLA